MLVAPPAPLGRGSAGRPDSPDSILAVPSLPHLSPNPLPHKARLSPRSYAQGSPALHPLPARASVRLLWCVEVGWHAIEVDWLAHMLVRSPRLTTWWCTTLSVVVVSCGRTSPAW